MYIIILIISSLQLSTITTTTLDYVKRKDKEILKIGIGTKQRIIKIENIVPNNQEQKIVIILFIFVTLGNTRTIFVL